jgi:hypothetical protein
MLERQIQLHLLLTGDNRRRRQQRRPVTKHGCIDSGDVMRTVFVDDLVKVC